MIHAYSELFLYDAMNSLGETFDFALRQKRIPPDIFQEKFLDSFVSQTLSIGCLRYVSGISAQECAGLIMDQEFEAEDFIDYGPEYWAGWILAYTQWYSGYSFRAILDATPLVVLLRIFHPLHEANETKARDIILERMGNGTPLSRIRKEMGLTQDELSRRSSIPIRNIRAYEQEQNDICKAEAETVAKLAVALHCSMEDLLRHQHETERGAHFHLRARHPAAHAEVHDAHTGGRSRIRPHGRRIRRLPLG